MTDATYELLTKQLKEKDQEIELLKQRIDEMKDRAFADDNYIKHLENERRELDDRVHTLKVQGRSEINQLEYDLEYKTAQARNWKKKYYAFKETLVRAGDSRVVKDKVQVQLHKNRTL